MNTQPEGSIPWFIKRTGYGMARVTPEGSSGWTINYDGTETTWDTRVSPTAVTIPSNEESPNA